MLTSSVNLEQQPPKKGLQLRRAERVYQSIDVDKQRKANLNSSRHKVIKSSTTQQSYDDHKQADPLSKIYNDQAELVKQLEQRYRASKGQPDLSKSINPATHR